MLRNFIREVPVGRTAAEGKLTDLLDSRNNPFSHLWCFPQNEFASKMQKSKKRACYNIHLTSIKACSFAEGLK